MERSGVFKYTRVKQTINFIFKIHILKKRLCKKILGQKKWAGFHIRCRNDKCNNNVIIRTEKATLLAMLPNVYYVRVIRAILLSSKRQKIFRKL